MHTEWEEKLMLTHSGLAFCARKRNTMRRRNGDGVFDVPANIKQAVFHIVC